MSRNSGAPQPEERTARKRSAQNLLRRLTDLYPAAACALHFANPFQLLVATILSAQCTDVRVNLVTPAVFRNYEPAGGNGCCHGGSGGQQQ